MISGECGRRAQYSKEGDQGGGQQGIAAASPAAAPDRVTGRYARRATLRTEFTRPTLATPQLILKRAPYG